MFKDLPLILHLSAAFLLCCLIFYFLFRNHLLPYLKEMREIRRIEVKPPVPIVELQQPKKRKPRRYRPRKPADQKNAA